MFDIEYLPSHWDYPNGPRCMMKRVYYKDDVDKLLERALVFDSWDDVWEFQEALFYKIKRNCDYAQSHKYFNDKERYKKSIKTIKRLCFFYKRLKQIRTKILEVANNTHGGI